ncbi:MAG: glycosyltransferase [Owenweeksia sp.]|nr:glycosyltransferase [Owenweeksia sp.]
MAALPYKPSHIYWFAYYNLASPSVRYRALYPLSYLSKQFDIDSSLVVPGYHPSKIWLFVKVYFTALFRARPDSVVVVQRVHSRFIYATLLKIMLRHTKAHTVYDLDDADYLERPGRSLFYFIGKCQNLSVGSHELAHNLTPLNSNIVINTSPTPRLNISKSGKSGKLHLGWIGCFGGGHKQSLTEQFFPALLQLHFPVKLTILGVERLQEQAFLENYFSQVANIELHLPQNINWKDEREVQARIAAFDVGIATLLDDELHRSKSAFKLKQYLNCGVPVLSTNIPENNRFLKDGVNGFLCSTTSDFLQNIERFEKMDSQAYAQMQQAARQSVSQFDMNHYCDILMKINTSPYVSMPHAPASPRVSL